MSSKIKRGLPPNINCPNCSSIPLIGLNFLYENKNLSEVCELYSYCIFNHGNKKKESYKNKLDNIFNKNTKKIIQDKNNLKCEFCKKIDIKYHCIDCQRNICKDCFTHHKKHKYYYNKEYISEKELNEIKINFEKSQKNIKKNLNLINNKIKEFESQLEELKVLYEKYKDINDKLYKFCDYILQQYIDLSQSQEDIYYPIYFNVKNILLFNPKQINLPNNDISITSFTNILNEKLISGYYFFITNSNFSDDITNYYEKTDKINYDLIDLNEFNKKEIEYEKMISFYNNKIIGIKYSDNSKDNKLDIYNIKNRNIESKLSLQSQEKIFYNQKYNILIFLYSKKLYIINTKNFSIIQEFSANHDIEEEKKEYTSSLWSDSQNRKNDCMVEGQFTHVEFLSKNSFAIIFNGDIRCLGEEYGHFYNTEGIKVINSDDKCYGDNNYGAYYHLIIYKKEKEAFVPKEIIPLLRNHINTNEVDLVIGKYDYVYEGDYPYCKFIFDSMIKIKENDYIFAFYCEIVASRNQSYYYITDKIYKNETIFYKIDIKESESIDEKICATNERSVLLRDESDGNFYYLYKESEKFNENLEKIFKDADKKLIKVEFNKGLNITNIFVHKNNIIFWDKGNIYFGKILGNKLEIINNNNMENNRIIKFISLEEKTIFYKNEDDSQNLNNENRRFRRVQNEESDEELDEE